jgi:hypothetical protein
MEIKNFLRKVLLKNKLISKKPKVLYINHKIVKIGDAVYQFRNMTGFNITEIKDKSENLFPNKPLLVVYSIGFILANIGMVRILGIVTLSLATLGIIVNNLEEEKEYNITFSFNSGEKESLIIKGEKFKQDVVSTLNTIMESNEEVVGILNFHDQSIKIEYCNLISSIVGHGNNI